MQAAKTAEAVQAAMAVAAMPPWQRSNLNLRR